MLKNKNLHNKKLKILKNKNIKNQKLKIKEIREKAGLSQDAMAEIMNISQSTYARFETQTSKIDLDRLEVFAKALNMTILDVITFPDRYINVVDIGKEINRTEPEVIVQIKVTKSKREEILKTILGENVELLNE